MSGTENQDAPHKGLSLHIRLYLIGILFFGAGLLACAGIYATTADDVDGAIGYESIDGKLYPIMPGDTKRYQYDLERVGGKSAVLAAELDNWFSSLWHGKKLGRTLVFLSTCAALLCFMFGRLLSAQPSREKYRDKDN